MRDYESWSSELRYPMSDIRKGAREAMTEYKDTLNLPRTSFPMRAKLPKSEPRMLEHWQEVEAFSRMTGKKEDAPSFVLHDGPPYANGHIHLGTATNKILKDIIVKSQNLLGYRAEYVPGWDCHGLPIELKVEQEQESGGGGASPLDIRRRCREYALKYLDVQRKEFKRLGVFGTWDAPYLTMTPEYQASIAAEFVRFIRTGAVERRMKPIQWCPSCQTALAEAEVEYHPRTSPSIYVRFPVIQPEFFRRFPQVEDSPVYALIWTTTPWTIPANQAIALHPEQDYVLVRAEGEAYLLAEKLLAQCAELFGWREPQVLVRFRGEEAEGFQASHPLYERPSHFVLADHVTLETGTGCVHTAPGHGQEDYETGRKYDLPVYAPLDDEGRFFPEVEGFAGKNVFQADPDIIQALQDKGNLMAQSRMEHSYPHCWRCKKPVIFRATTQWFISMDRTGLRERAIQEIDRVRWIPAWGKQRIRDMVANRPDWCISRQRAWGVPIVALICSSCGEAYYDPDWADAVVSRFAEHPRGADYWFESDVADLAPEGLTCENCGGRDFAKETDILDVWFDSGTSFAAVLEKRPECTFPADLYLEGSDQHRGWFHSSLLVSVGTRKTAPYESVLTHGFVVDGEGKKMSKSMGNVIAPQEIIEQYGAEILRIWTASENYQEDMRISTDILRQLVDNYRRIRNTCRFILGNLSDFHPEEHDLEPGEMLPMDRYALQLLQDRQEHILSAYRSYELHKVFHSLHGICVSELSSFYLDVLKDRLYVSHHHSTQRRSAQSALYRILLLLIRDMAPILSFTAEEIYQNLPKALKPEEATVFGLRMPEAAPPMEEEEKRFWDLLLTVRGEVSKAVEPVRRQGTVGHSLDCRITLYAEDWLYQKLQQAESTLPELCIVSQLGLESLELAPQEAYRSEEMEGLAVGVEPASGEKCPRCWHFSQGIGTDREQPEVCPRCAEVLRQLELEEKVE